MVSKKHSVITQNNSELRQYSEQDIQLALRLLQSWLEEDDDEEQQETLEYLMQVLDEDRSSDRKLFA